MAQVQTCDEDCTSAKEKSSWGRLHTTLYECTQPSSISQSSKCCGGLSTYLLQLFTCRFKFHLQAVLPCCNVASDWWMNRRTIGNSCFIFPLLLVPPFQKTLSHISWNPLFLIFLSSSATKTVAVHNLPLRLDDLRFWIYGSVWNAAEQKVKAKIILVYLE